MNLTDLNMIFKILPEVNLGRNFFKQILPIPKYINFWEYYNSGNSKSEFNENGYHLRKPKDVWIIEKTYEKKIPKVLVNNKQMDLFLKPKTADLSGYGLYDYQIPHVNNLINGLEKYGRILDVSPPGMGKTICSLSAAAEMGVPVIIIGVKIHNWITTINKIGNICLLLSTYDSLKNGHQLFLSDKGKIKKDSQSYVTIVNSNDEYNSKIFQWNVPSDVLFIIDEIHKAKNPHTQNSDLVTSIAKLPNKILGLSASMGEDPIHFYGPGRVMKMWNKDWEFYTEFLPNHFCNKQSHEGRDFWQYNGEQWGMLKIAAELEHQILKMDIKAVRRDFLFPNTRIIPDIIYSDDAEEFNILWFKYKEADIHERQQILMTIELLKTEYMAERAKIWMDQGYSVVIFVNYTKSLLKLGDLLKTTCFYYGEIDENLKEANRKSFESNDSLIIICNIAAGGASIDLHDIHHQRPRISIISPTYSATNLLQTLGRIDRANGTDTIQYIFYIGDTIEAKVAESVKQKIGNLQALNDKDITPIQYL